MVTPRQGGDRRHAGPAGATSGPAAASLRGPELAIDHDPEPGQVDSVDGEPPERPARGIPSLSGQHRRADRRGGPAGVKHPDGEVSGAGEERSGQGSDVCV
jgi:hypothetical protein